MMEWTYTYTESGTQYESYDLTEPGIVPAEYVRSKTDLDNGNPYIEALPVPRDAEEIHRAYQKPLTGYRYEEQKALSRYDKLSAIAALRKIRFELPFHRVLEEDFYMALLVSYRSRRMLLTPGNDVAITSRDIETGVNGLLYGESGAASNAGFTLLGYSGCGKSASLEILLSHYPQVIAHTIGDGTIQFTQIVYLVVVCPANSNFSALYISIGAEIDRALGNIRPTYEKMIRRARTLGDKAAAVCRLIEVFGIGAIIFDEIQLLDFAGQKESTFESLLTIVNQTKVALISVGTRDAYSKMFPNLRTSRRTGVLINANSYCADKRYFASMVTELFRYQWTDTFIKPDAALIRALYDATRGIIDQLISIYMYMQIDYIRADEDDKPDINAAYVQKIADTYFPGIQGLLQNLEEPDADASLTKLISEAKAGMTAVLDKERQEAAKRDIMEAAGSRSEADREAIRDNAIQNIRNTIRVTKEVYNESRIEKAVDHVMGLKRNFDLDEEAVTAKAYDWLKKNKSDKRRTPAKKPVMDAVHLDMRSSLLDGMDSLLPGDDI